MNPVSGGGGTPYYSSASPTPEQEEINNAIILCKKAMYAIQSGKEAGEALWLCEASLKTIAHDSHIPKQLQDQVTMTLVQMGTCQNMEQFLGPIQNIMTILQNTKL